MKKLLSLLIVFLLVSCSSPVKEPKELKILSPTGAPAVALIPVMSDNVELVSGPDNLQAALVNENSEYDVVIAPLNLGANLISQNKTKFKLHSIVTWGNLFLVARNPEVKTLAVFGEMAVPGLVFKAIQDELKLDGIEVQWVPSVQEAQALLMSDKVDAAMLAQPLVAATLGKAKQEGIELSILSNLQEVYNQKFGVNSYPQAALFVHESVSENDVNALVKEMSEYVANIPNKEADFLADVESVTAEKLGIPNGQLIFNSFKQLGLELKQVGDVKEEIKQFLELFNLSLEF